MRNIRCVHFIYLLLFSFLLGGCCLSGSGNANRNRHSGQSYQPSQEPAYQKPPSTETKTGKSETYIVVGGDTLAGISKKFYGSTVYWRYIAEYNGIEDPRKLKIGQNLDIPDKIGYPTSIKVRTDDSGVDTYKQSSKKTKTTSPEKKPKKQEPAKETDLFNLSDGETPTKKSADESSGDSKSLDDEGLFSIDDIEPVHEKDPEPSSTEAASKPAVSAIGSIRIEKSAPMISRPSALDSGELAIIPSGATLEYVEFSRGYYKVNYENQTGYIHRRYTREINNEE